MSNPNLEDRFDEVFEKLSNLLDSIGDLDSILDISSFATARTMNQLMDALAEFIITNSAQNDPDTSWLRRQLNQVLQGHLSRYGAAIDVEISVQECTCRWVPWGDEYYWKSLKKEQFSYVVSRDDGIC